MLDLQDAYQRQNGDLITDDSARVQSSIRFGTHSFAFELGSLAFNMDSPDLCSPAQEWDAAARAETNLAEAAQSPAPLYS